MLRLIIMGSLMLCAQLLITKQSCAQGKIQQSSYGMGVFGAASGKNCKSFNPAFLGYLQEDQILLAFQRGFIREQSTAASKFSLKTGKGVLAGGISCYGYSLYSENNIQLAYGNQLFPRFYLGTELHFSYIHNSADYLKQYQGWFSLGFVYQFNDNITLGTVLIHPAKSFLNTSSTTPSAFHSGLAWQIANHLIVALETEKREHEKFRYHLGADLSMLDYFHIRGGVSSSPFTHSFGFAYEQRKINFEIGFERHIILGYQSKISVLYKIRKK